MRYGIRTGALIGFFFALPAAAEDKPAPPPVKKYVDAGSLQGKLERVNTTTSEMVISYRGVGQNARTEHQELTLADDVKVWFKTPPERVDESGNPKKLTPAELDKIKSKYGPTRGLYAGELSDLHNGQQVVVALGKPKDAVKKPAPKQKGVAPEKEFIYVTAVVVTVDAKPPPKPDKKK